MKHKHYDLIVAWADGAEIEFENTVSHWVVTPTPNWSTNTEYRVKPKPKPNKELLVAMVFKNVLEEPTIISTMYICEPDEISPMTNVKFTFDGETGEFLKVEKI